MKAVLLLVLASWIRWTRGVGVRESASFSSRIQRKCTKSPSTGSPSMKSSPREPWAGAATKKPRCRYEGRTAFGTRFLDQMDTRRWGPGERIFFEPYSKEVYEESFDWIAKHEIFAEGA